MATPTWDTEVTKEFGMPCGEGEISVSLEEETCTFAWESHSYRGEIPMIIKGYRDGKPSEGTTQWYIECNYEGPTTVSIFKGLVVTFNTTTELIWIRDQDYFGEWRDCREDFQENNTMDRRTGTPVRKLHLRAAPMPKNDVSYLFIR